MAVRVPVREAYDVCALGAAMRVYFEDTRNVAEGAGAEPLAALLEERGHMTSRKVGAIFRGGNVGTKAFAEVLTGRTPVPARSCLAAACRRPPDGLS